MLVTGISNQPTVLPFLSLILIQIMINQFPYNFILNMIRSFLLKVLLILISIW